MSQRATAFERAVWAHPERCRCASTRSGVAQWLACWAHNSKVGGSKPLSATFCLIQEYDHRAIRRRLRHIRSGSMAEWSKAPALGAGPKGRGFEPHCCHLLFLRIDITRTLLTSCSTLRTGLWCSGITSALHAEGLGFEPRQVQLGHLFLSFRYLRVVGQRNALVLWCNG